MVDGLGGEAAHDAEPVRDAGRVRQQLAELGAALAVPLEGEGRADQGQGGLVGGHRGEPLPLADAGGEVLPLPFREQRLVVQELELARSPALEQPHHAACSRGVMEDLLGADPRQGLRPHAQEAGAAGGQAQGVPAGRVRELEAHRRLTLAWWEKTVTAVRVQAACSTGSRPSGSGASPTERAAEASSGWVA